MLNKCYFCKGEVVQQNVAIDYRWGEDLMIINDVPCGVCQQCGEKYLSSDVYRELERIAKNKKNLKSKITVDVLAFKGNIAA